MRKILSIILAVFMLISNTFVVFASEDVEFYAYTTDTTGFDEYAKKELSAHIYAYYGYADNSLKLGKGISILEKEIPTVMYLIWKNKEIVGTFNVIYHEGQYSGSYSNGNVEQLNYIKKLSSIDKPIRLIKKNGNFVALLDDVVYDMTEGVGKTINNKIISTFSSVKLSEINAGATLEYTRINLKAASSWTLPWDPIEHNGNSSVNCYAYSLSPIFRSL